MKLHFLGGASEVGRLGMVLQRDGHQLLFDYGITPSSPPKYPNPAPMIDLAFLTHAHVDHSGMIPWLAGEYDTEVRMTSVTAAFSEILARDSLKICGYEGYPKPFDRHDIKAAIRNVTPIRHRHTDYFYDLILRYHSAGHIPGSTMYEIQTDETFLFTGDLNTIDTHLMKGAEPVRCDTLMIEGTYAGRSHAPRCETERAFIEKVDEVIARGGQVIVPVFALGRTQEVLLMLDEAPYEIWVDGMGKLMTKIMLKHPWSVRDAKRLRKALKRVEQVRTPAGRKRASHADIILTTSGMLDGGPVLYYLEHLKDNPKNAVLLTGYQVEGTNGRKLVEEGYVDIDGERCEINAEVRFYDFSAHAGHTELCQFIRDCDPDRLVLYHSDDRSPLVEEFRDEMEIFCPMEGETLNL